MPNDDVEHRIARACPDGKTSMAVQNVILVYRLVPNTMITIARERPEHFAAIRQLTIDAFAASEFGHNGEADLVESIREQSADLVSLVAIADNRVVGHIMFSPATIHTASSVVLGAGLAPMAVLPAFQRNGVGSRLVTEGLRQLAELDVAFTIVAGHPEYYRRFGFLPARDFSVIHGFDGMPQEVLFVYLHDQKWASQIRDGVVYYDKAFGRQQGG